jgi:CRISPR-associated endoribonuclease Cas6
MYRLCLKVDSPAPFRGNPVGVLSRRFHAFVLKSLQQESPQLSQEVHDRKERQVFSTHLLLNRGEIRINTPDREVVSCLQRYFLREAGIDLLDWRGSVREVHCQTFDSSRIDERFSTSLTLYFLTPTTFYQWKNYYPLPELKRLFSSAAKVSEIITGERIEWESLEPLIYPVRIEDLNVKTERVRFGEFNVIGFKGKMAMSLKALPEASQRMIWRLLAYGSLMGFGYKTAWGLGQTLLDPLEDARTFFRTPGASSKTR